MEERLGSVDYDVWACAVCDERLIIPYTRLWLPIAGCPRCAFRTVQSSTVTVRAASTLASGLEETHLECANCGWSTVTMHETPRIVEAAATSASSFGGASSGWSEDGADGGGSSGGGDSSFGGSGETAGGGGGDSY
jgi:uncharacterized protein